MMGWVSGQTYRAIVEVEEGRAEELSPLPEDLVGARPVVRRRRVVEGRHLGDGVGAILWRGRGDGGRGEAGVGPGGDERRLEEPPGGGEALHVRRCGFRGWSGRGSYRSGAGAGRSCLLG